MRVETYCVVCCRECVQSVIIRPRSCEPGLIPWVRSRSRPIKHPFYGQLSLFTQITPGCPGGKCIKPGKMQSPLNERASFPLSWEAFERARFAASSPAPVIISFAIISRRELKLRSFIKKYIYTHIVLMA